MRLRLVVGVIVFFIVAAVVLAGIMAGPGLFASGTSIGDSQTPVTSGNPIVLENTHVGTSSWKIPVGKASSTQIQAYASATSALPGQQLTFYVSTLNAGTAYSIDIYRLGWYAGSGGRLMLSVPYRTGHAQGYYDSASHLLVNCLSCHFDPKTGLVEANWQPSYTLAVPPDWTTGIYLAKFTDVNGKQTYVPFDVRGNSHSLYVAVTPDTTYAAYNIWGGYSLYQAASSVPLDEAKNAQRGVKVSFDRPYTTDNGSSQVLVFEADAVHWLERQGYDLSYISDVDLHEQPAQLLDHRAYLSLGHDEYWTKEMRDGVEHARDRGVGLAFLGADAGYWQMRFEPDSAGRPDRTIVCYKVQTANNDLALDPLYRRDKTLLTTQWRDPALARPENALIGIMYSDLTHQQQGFPWTLSPLAKSALLDGTGLRPGQQYGCGLVGYEWDSVFANGATPKGLQVIGASHTVNDTKKPGTGNTTYYIAPSGVMVFATGSIYWALALDNYRFQTDKLCAGQSLVVPGMQKLMAHVMDALVVHHPVLQQTLVPTTTTAVSIQLEIALSAVVDSSSSKRRMTMRPLSVDCSE